MSKKETSPGNDLMQFFVGLAMFCVGGYLFLQNVVVYGISFSLPFFRNDAQGLVFIPLIASIVFLFEFSVVKDMLWCQSVTDCCNGNIQYAYCMAGNIIVCHDCYICFAFWWNGSAG